VSISLSQTKIASFIKACDKLVASLQIKLAESLELEPRGKLAGSLQPVFKNACFRFERHHKLATI
jgi:hypothetical protein